MNKTLLEVFMRQRLSSPVRLFLLIPAFIVPILTVFFVPSLDPAGKQTTALFALIFAVGAIGQDVSSGVLQLVFARPVRRAEYVLHRWFAAGAAAAALGLLQCALAGALMALRGHVPPNGFLFAALAENALTGFGTAAVIVMFSSLVNGIGDLAVYFLSTTLVGLIGTAARFKNWTIVARAAGEVNDFLQPQPSLAWIAGGGDVSWFVLASWASTVTLSLVVAIWLVDRKELSYAAG